MRKTDKIRIKLDFVLELKEPVEDLPSLDEGPNTDDDCSNAIWNEILNSKRLRKKLERLGVVGFDAGATASESLDFRK